MKSGWCMQPLKSKSQHESCKHIFTGSGAGSGAWTCNCSCHGGEEIDTKPKDRAARTKGKE